MKVLIVDDNVAVQEIVRDILTERSHIVRLASNVDEAVEKIRSFEPEVVMLDSKVGEEDGLKVITRVGEELPGFNLRVILIKSSGEIAPKDIPEIKVCVDKPFKSSEILEAVNELMSSEAEQEAEETAIKKARKQKRSIFSRKKRDRYLGPTAELSESGIEFGRSYAIFEPEPERVYEFISKFNTSEYGVLIVTSDRPKAIMEKFDYGNMEIVPLSTSGRAGSEGIHALGSLMVRIKEFISKHERPVIVFDNFGEIIEENGLNSSLLMLQQTMAGRSGTCTFAVSVDARPLTDKDRGILLHNMTEYRD